MFERPSIFSSEPVWMMQDSQVDDELLLKTLIEEYGNDVFQLAHLLVEKTEIARRITQKTFQQAVARRNRFGGDVGLKVWLFSLAVKNYSAWKRWAGWRLLFHPEGNGLIDESRLRETWVEVEALPKTLRLPLQLRYLHALAFNEITMVLGISAHELHSRYHRIRNLLGGQALLHATHEDIGDMIAMQWDGSSDAAMEQEVENHFLVCSSCKQDANQLQMLDAKLGSYVKEHWELPVNAEHFLREIVSYSAASPTVRRWVARETIFGALVAVLVLVLLAYNQFYKTTPIILPVGPATRIVTEVDNPSPTPTPRPVDTLSNQVRGSFSPNPSVDQEKAMKVLLRNKVDSGLASESIDIYRAEEVIQSEFNSRESTCHTVRRERIDGIYSGR